jgi:hypothetical protein
MPEHFTRGTLECTAWCNKCRRNTQHRVDHPAAGGKGGGRRGPCLEHTAAPLSQKQLEAKKKREKEALNPRLFE